MKHIYGFLLLINIILPTLLHAQVVNADFETWFDGAPQSWATTNYPLVATPITRSNESHSGLSAVKGEMVKETTQGEIFPPVITSIPNPETFQRYSSMQLYYKFHPVEGDQLTVTVLMYNDITLLGGGAVQIFDEASSYTNLTVPIEYFFEGEPNYCLVIIGAGYDNEEINGHLGTWFLVDDITFSGGTTGIDDKNNNGLPEGFVLSQNYPNPFNPSTTIEFSLPAAQKVSLKIYNLLGEEVASLFNEKEMSAGSHRVQWDAGNLANGTYIYSLTSGNYSLTKKMILLK